MSTLHLAALFIASVIASLVAFQGGLRIGRWRSQRLEPEPQLPVRTLVASILSLLAFILGFVFGSAESHHDARSQSVFDEAVAIGAAYRRTDLLPDLERTNMRRLLRSYVDARLDAAQSSKRSHEMTRLRQLQAQMWAQAIAAETHDGSAPVSAAFMQSLADVIDVRGERVLAGMQSRIPSRVWVALYTIMFVSIGSAGYLAGLAGARRSFAAVAYAVVFSAVVVMIVAGDVPGPEQFRTTHQALMDLRARLAAP